MITTLGRGVLLRADQNNLIAGQCRHSDTTAKPAKLRYLAD
jgi:hypothetical protein